MPRSAFWLVWLLILPPVFLLLLDHALISNFALNSLRIVSQDILQLSNMFINNLPWEWRPGPDLEERSMLLLNLVCLFIVWRTAFSVKHGIYQWTEEQIQTQHATLEEIKDLNKSITVLKQQLKRYKNTVASTNQENEDLKESSKTCMVVSLREGEDNCGLKAGFDLDQKLFDAERANFQKKVEMTTSLLLQKEHALQQKLAQEEQLCERETSQQSQIKALEARIAEMTREHEKNEGVYKTQIKELGEHFAGLENSLSSSKCENKMLKESLKTCKEQNTSLAEKVSGLKESLEQQHQTHQNEIRSLESHLERTINQMQAMGSSLKESLAEEELLHHEREAYLHAFETRLVEITLEGQNSEELHKTQIKELELHSADLENALCSARYDNESLKKILEENEQMHQDEVKSLKIRLERTTNQMEEMESNLKKALAQENARTAEVKEQAAQYKEELLKVTKERQKFLKDEIRHHKDNAHANWVAYREAERALARERSKMADMRKKLAELNNKLAEYSGKPPETDVTVQSGLPSTSEITAVDQDRNRKQQDGGWNACRGRRGYGKLYDPYKWIKNTNMTFSDFKAVSES